MASADEYRQTRSPDGKSKKAMEEECHIKQRMTSHWDLDYLTRDELEEVMAQGVGDPDQRDTGQEASENPRDEVDEKSEHPVRTGLLLLGISLLMVAGAAFLLQSASG